MALNVFALLASAVALSQLAAGQNASYTGNCTASLSNAFEWINSTGVANFTFPELAEDSRFYYYSVLSEYQGNVDVGRWLGIPESALGTDPKTRTLCAFSLGGVSNSPKPGTKGNATCDGVISADDKCLHKQEESEEFEGCPAVDTRACDWDIRSTQRIPLWKNVSCSAPEVPAMQVPDGYHVVWLGTDVVTHSAENEEYKEYDEYVRRSSPLVLTVFKTNQQGKNELITSTLYEERVCVAPTDVQQGSKEVAPKEPDEPNASVRVHMSLFAAVVALSALLL